jgi:hypothetical protein
MRLRRRLALACTVAISLLALLATGASAFKHRSPSGRCRVDIQVVPRRITAGEPVTIFGRLVCRGRASAADQVVRLFHHVLGAPGFTYVQSTTTDALGFYQFQRADGVVETNRIWRVRAHGAESANKGVRVAAQVTLSGPPEGTQILTGPANKVTFTGTVTPADAGARVILQRQNALTGNEWRRIDSGVVAAGGGFSITHTFIVPGDANLRVLVRSQGRNIPSPSDVLSYEISQAQNPQLTIAASADPIVYGQSVTINGTLAGGADKPVVLLARTAHQHGFAPVAQATTNGSGDYVFAAQTPVNSTFYEVETSTPSCAAGSPPRAACPIYLCPAHTACGGGSQAMSSPVRYEPPVKSAVLYEGVRNMLSAQVSPTSILEGQIITFTGSVAPSHPGHVIYLERQDASGQGFHVVQVSTLSQESTFSIPYQVYSTGTVVFRVHIPGGPDNGGAASQLFAIQVAAAPAATLMAETPGNSSGPAEGSTSPSEVEKEGEERETGARPPGEGESAPGRHHHR